MIRWMTACPVGRCTRNALPAAGLRPCWSITQAPRSCSDPEGCVPFPRWRFKCGADRLPLSAYTQHPLAIVALDAGVGIIEHLVKLNDQVEAGQDWVRTATDKKGTSLPVRSDNDAVMLEDVRCSAPDQADSSRSGRCAQNSSRRPCTPLASSFVNRRSKVPRS
jgi:hypothetical protein